MRQLLFVWLIFLPITLCFGQDFLHSDDYVYGVGSSLCESTADSLALLSFSKCVHVNVDNTLNRTVTESKTGYDETYFNNVTINSNISVSGLKKYVTFENGVFVVYYYLNKSEYIKRCLEEYNENIRLANEYDTLNCPHSDNLMLGYYYLALEIMSDDMLMSFYRYSKVARDGLITTISEKYKYLEYYLTARNVEKNNHSGIYRIREENSKTLPGFEYFKNGKWIIPHAYLDEHENECGYESAKWAYIYTYENKYRYLFEVKTDYGLVKINVPNEFYSRIEGYRIFYF